jgi:transcriptional regulator with XRE-family HTH domain
MTSQVTKDPGTILARNIRIAREAKDWTQRELASRVNGLDSLAVSRWERAVSVPRQENLQALAEATGQPLAWFYTDHSEQKAQAA